MELSIHAVDRADRLEDQTMTHRYFRELPSARASRVRRPR